MKKAILIFLSLIITVSCVACIGDNVRSLDPEPVSDSDSEPEVSSVVVSEVQKDYDIALITDSKALEDETNMSLWKSIVAYGDTNSKTYQYYTAESIEKNGESAIKEAIEDHVKIVVLPSSSYKSVVLTMQDKYPDVSFLLVGTQPDEKLGDNVHCIKFKEEQAGYLAGYFAVMEGYTTVGFIGDGDNARNMRYVYGVVQGADDATQELRIHDVSVKYTFIDAKEDKAKSVSKKMYESGVDVIFACNSKIIKGVAQTARDKKKKIICGEKVYDEYGDVVLESIAFNNMEAVDYSIKTSFDSNLNWKENNDDNNINLGIENNCIYIPNDDESWKFENFNYAFYEDVCERFVNGEVEVTDKTDSKPPIASVVYSYFE